MNRTLPLKKLVAAIVACTAMVACGHGPDPKIEQARVSSAQQYAAYYNKVKGDYDQLDPADKATLVKLAGSEANVQKAWRQMKAARSPRRSGGAAPRPGKPGA